MLVYRFWYNSVLVCYDQIFFKANVSYSQINQIPSLLRFSSDFTYVSLCLRNYDRIFSFVTMAGD